MQGALWTGDMIDGTGVRTAPELRRIVVAVDPSGTAGGDNGDDIGIVVAGIGYDKRGYVLADAAASNAAVIQPSASAQRLKKMGR